MRITAKELASMLSISPSAVSLAINGKPGISDDTRRRVLEAASKYGYAAQKKLPKQEKSGGGMNIRYVIYQSSSGDISDLESSFFSMVLQGVDAKARELGYNVLVSYFYENGNWDEQIRAISSGAMGVILLATALNTKYMPQFAQMGIPVVVVDNDGEYFDLDCVVSDNRRSSFGAMSTLIQMGHRRICYVSSNKGINNFKEREIGVLKAEEMLLSPLGGQLYTLPVGDSSETVYRQACRWLGEISKEKEGPPTALLADNDVIAAACMRALSVSGFRIPEDVSVIGFDDLPVCAVVEPPLTSVQVFKSQMGEIAMNRLHIRLVEDRREYVRIILSTTLKMRDSVAPPRTDR